MAVDRGGLYSGKGGAVGGEAWQGCVPGGPKPIAQAMASGSKKER